MSISATCGCGRTYDLNDDLAGKRIKCPSCTSTFEVPNPWANARPQAHAVFERDKFLLRQKLMSFKAQRYFVSDENGNDIIEVERPYHRVKSLLAAGGFLGVLVAAIVSGLALLTQFDPPGGGAPPDWAIIGMLVWMAVGAVLAVVVLIRLAPKRHVSFMVNGQKTLEILQDKKFQLIIQTFTLREASGQTLALFRKNILTNVFRKRWWVLRPDDQTPMLRAQEDSIILSLLRRLLGPLFGLLRTNFIITPPESDQILGEFNRKLTLLDRYVLDFSGDRSRSVDRRIGLALGVLLDTGERR